MLNTRLMNLLAQLALATVLFAIGSEAWAGTASGIGSIAANVTGNLLNIAKLITAASYVAGMAFAVGAIIKFKAHKDAPTQTPLGVPMVMLFVGISLIFIPAIFSSGGATLFGSSTTGKSSVSGLSSF